MLILRLILASCIYTLKYDVKIIIFLAPSMMQSVAIYETATYTLCRHGFSCLQVEIHTRLFFCWPRAQSTTF